MIKSFQLNATEIRSIGQPQPRGLYLFEGNLYQVSADNSHPCWLMHQMQVSQFLVEVPASGGYVAAVALTEQRNGVSEDALLKVLGMVLNNPVAQKILGT